MHTLVIYESMYGNTRSIAEAVADSLRAEGEVRVTAVRDADDVAVAWADLVIVGGPTHIHGMTRASTRKTASDRAAEPGSELTLEPEAIGPGIRDWLGTVGKVQDKRAAAFDTRAGGPSLFTGAASGGIASGLRGRGFKLVAKPESFLVDKQSALVAGELDRAARWGAGLAGLLVPAR